MWWRVLEAYRRFEPVLENEEEFIAYFAILNVLSDGTFLNVKGIPACS
jgi:hypothetical protein